MEVYHRDGRGQHFKMKPGTREKILNPEPGSENFQTRNPARSLGFRPGTRKAEPKTNPARNPEFKIFDTEP